MRLEQLLQREQTLKRLLAQVKRLRHSCGADIGGIWVDSIEKSIEQLDDYLKKLAKLILADRDPNERHPYDSFVTTGDRYWSSGQSQWSIRVGLALSASDDVGECCALRDVKFNGTAVDRLLRSPLLTEQEEEIPGRLEVPLQPRVRLRHRDIAIPARLLNDTGREVLKEWWGGCAFCACSETCRFVDVATELNGDRAIGAIPACETCSAKLLHESHPLTPSQLLDWRRNRLSIEGFVSKKYEVDLDVRRQLGQEDELMRLHTAQPVRAHIIEEVEVEPRRRHVAQTKDTATEPHLRPLKQRNPAALTTGLRPRQSGDTR